MININNFIFILIILNIYTIDSRSTPKKTNLKQKCDVPISADPFDESLRPYIKKIEPAKCYNNFYYAELDLKTGIIKPRYSTIKERACNCVWNALKIITASADKNQFIFKEFKEFNSTLDMNELRNEKNTDLVLIRCRCGFLRMQKSEKLFSYPNYKIDGRKGKAPIQLDEKLDRAIIDKNGTKKCPIAPNVIVVVIESLSFLNFKRHMNKTQKLFEQHFNETMVEFEGVIKVGDNSYPNMISLITGQPPKHYKYPYGVVNESYYDDEPLIWKDFEKKRGYYTGFIEDMPTFGIFNWVGKGFKVKNTDYYNRNFYCALNSFGINDVMSENCKPSSSQCYNGRHLLDIEFEQLESFMLKMEKEQNNYFAYIDPGYLTHDNFNMASVMDHHTSRFINRNYKSLRNSVFLFLGDHGNRFGKQMNSWVGRIESSWPYFAINIPKSVQKKYPNILPTLKKNSKRLVTWIDVNSSLKDLSNCDLEPKIYKEYKTKEADPSLIFANTTQIPTPPLIDRKSNYSLFTELVPTDRSCDEALIPSVFCICLPRVKISIDSFEAHRAGEEFVKQLNKRLEIYKNKCAELKLLKVKDISKVIKDTNSTTYDLVIETSPSNAIFRGELNQGKNEWILNNSFERFNKYGDDGNCINDKNLQKVCYCKT